jgi:hypothetical protein
MAIPTRAETKVFVNEFEDVLFIAIIGGVIHFQNQIAMPDNQGAVQSFCFLPK